MLKKHPVSTLDTVRAGWRLLLRLAAAVSLAGVSATAFGQSYIEDFDNIATLTGNGWVMQNNSTPVGALSWFQGLSTTATPTPGPFNSYNGAADSYIAVNFNSTGSSGTISNWLVTPNRTLRNGDVFAFYTRKPLIGSGMIDYPDRLEVRMSTNGASANVGAGANGLGDFTTLLLSVNPTLVANVYPQIWTQFTITISGLPAPTSGRIAFRYFVTGAGSLGTNSDYIGIDNVVYTPYVCPAFTITPGGALTGGMFGQTYSHLLTQSGALGAPNFAVTAGATPPGLTLAADGAITGTPTATGTFNFTVMVSDASGCSGAQSYSITVVPAPQVLSFPTQTVTSRWFQAATTFPIDPEASSATPNSGAPIVYGSLAPSVCSVAGTTVTMLAEGTCEITANQAGDANYAAAEQASVQVQLVIPTEADLWVTKTADVAIARIGDTVSYSIQVGNHGPADATDVGVLDIAPDRLDPDSVVWQCIEAIGTTCPDPDADAGDLAVTLAALPSGASVRFALIGQVVAAADPADDYTAFDNTAQVALPQGSMLTDPDENNEASASVLVIPEAIFADGFEAQ